MAQRSKERLHPCSIQVAFDLPGYESMKSTLPQKNLQTLDVTTRYHLRLENSSAFVSLYRDYVLCKPENEELGDVSGALGEVLLTLERSGFPARPVRHGAENFKLTVLEVEEKEDEKVPAACKYAVETVTILISK